MHNKISVIIPCYNADKYIDRCLETVLNQTLKEIEILLIDDGSVDKTLAILKQYQEKDDRIKVFVKENGGQSSARNMGLDNATGEFVAFIDIDDYVHLEMLETLYNDAVNTNSDMAVCSMQLIGQSEKAIEHNEESLLVFDKITAITHLLAEQYILFSVCDKIYNKSLFDGVRFPIGVIHEDVLLPYELVKKCNSICYTTRAFYFYCQNDGSTMTKKFTTARLNDISAREKIVADIKQNFPQLYENSLSTKLVGYLNIIHKLTKDNDSTYNDLLNNLVTVIKADKNLYLKSKFISKKRKLGVMLIAMCFPAYKAIYRAN